jgi:hypothetical protein
MGNEHSVEHEQNPYSAATWNGERKQGSSSSSMRRSRSVRQDANGLLLVENRQSSQHSSLSSNSTRYIPKMNRAGNGLVMPRPHGAPVAADQNAHPIVNGSEMSPQWGWYINTTPPPREMFQSRSRSFGNKMILTEGKNGAAAPSSYSSNVSSIDGKRCHNQIFQNLQSSNTPMGWTSVPI